MSSQLNKLKRLDNKLTEVVPVGSGDNLVRIKVSDREHRAALISNAKKLKDHPQFNNIFISRDFTFIQRRDKARQRELQRLASGGTDPSNPSVQSQALGAIALPIAGNQNSLGATVHSSSGTLAPNFQ